MANGKQKIWVSDLIGEDYKRWHNEFVILDCGTACGKTYFVSEDWENMQLQRREKFCISVIEAS